METRFVSNLGDLKRPCSALEGPKLWRFIAFQAFRASNEAV